MLYRYARHIIETIMYRRASHIRAHFVLQRHAYTNLDTISGPHYTLYGYIHYRRDTLYVIRLHTLEQGHIIRYTDVYTRVGSHYTLYGCIH